MEKWQRKVYHQARKDKIKITVQWLNVRKKVFERDKYRCQRCGDFYGEDSFILTAHHIIPRKKGGTNKLKNLITLCNECHNIVEILGRVDKYFDENSQNQNNKLIDTTNDWHKWVYGGYSSPY